MHGHLDLDLIFLCSGQQLVTWNWEAHNLFISNKDTPSWTSLWKGCLSRIDTSPTETPPVSKLYSSLKCSVTQNVLLPRLDISLILTTMKLEIFLPWTHSYNVCFSKMNTSPRWTLLQDGHIAKVDTSPRWTCMCLWRWALLKNGYLPGMDISIWWTLLWEGHLY